MKTRNAKKIRRDVTADQFEEAVEKYAIAEQREATINKCVAVEVNEVLEKYQDELLTLAQGKSIAFEIIQSYCVDNKNVLFGKRRNISTPHGVVGFRLGTPRLKTAKGKSWDKVLNGLKEKLPAYIRIVEEPAKDRLLTDRNKESVAPVLMELGVRIVQDELFYIETKKAA